MNISKVLHLPSDFTRALRKLRYNQEIIEDSDLEDKFPNNGHYQNSFEIVKHDNIYTIGSMTVENGEVTTNFSCDVDLQGNMIEGAVNCFSLGYMDVDQPYIDEYLTDIFNHPEKKDYWDDIE